MKRMLLIIWLAMLLSPTMSQAETKTVTWAAPEGFVGGGAMTDTEKAAIITVIEAGTLTSDNDIKWTEAGKSDPGATTWKGTVPDNLVALRAKHVLNGMYSPWTTISAPVQPRGLVVIIK